MELAHPIKLARARSHAFAAYCAWPCPVAGAASPSNDLAIAVKMMSGARAVVFVLRIQAVDNHPCWNVRTALSARDARTPQDCSMNVNM